MPRDGVTSQTEKASGKSLGENANYDVREGIAFNVYLEQELPEDRSTSALTHELTMHFNPNVDRLSRVEQQLNDGKLKPGTAPYLNKLQEVRYSGGIDHEQLGKGRNTLYQNISAQLDQLRGTSRYTELYKRDVEAHEK